MAEASLPTLPTLRLHDVACRRGGRWLFKALGFELAPGELLWLRGRNGSGKSSLLRLVTGLARPDGGSLRWGDEDVRDSARFRRELSYLAHVNALKAPLDAMASLAFLARCHGRDASVAALTAALDRLGLARHRDAPVGRLSEGQRRRVALARLALDERPGLWVLDEPFDALDADGGERLASLLHEHRARGGSVLLTSHAAQPLEALAPRALDLEAFA